ncbi:saccharopine dehydrogenase (NAD+, L-lysine forming) [Cryptococcus deuterogattii 99/473]|uniref:Saccharopine dehydrogenase [NAD(+), L-lysine-forming] n=2 Tax=Cryptococcus deuterogattii TaxID=1859096 RepID=A0A0D0V092_9TREE|nr:saccharopine dehydrogenase (NAD+ L-lysine forming) [Cryptococcus deuterogattii R265]KIR25925.1 saccharopine dehydrogenase (NAD+, L-lysine forming) [Cryptococcus deuterogattii LA55]KIR40891.1 saccharopine dehydrogenase (NAD+, L-lysine forming) [Cryptococcus deuterogattii Ram5]KIR72247.1 saccharopine dehydrogenase (NAD+, L-lysine forming) [Cryptococcus deuterogattii CA1014]KIR91838.1 saccharopine dehydrogenase (NAD+, L-lysine forming) [Cryptococcus deuterogattii CBS 10090]KIR97651.1 saccharop
MAATAPESATTSANARPRQPIWLRCEKKPFEHRSALTPTTAKKLLDSNFDVYVEKDPQRIFDDSEFEAVGCKIVPHNTWPSAPLDVPIIGLKELPESTEPLPHTHIQFAHCYKHQGGWNDVLRRFAQGKGTLYDLEFLEDPVSHRRVAAFGFHAGFAGAAAGALAFAAQQTQNGQGKLGELKPYPNEGEMVKEVSQALESTKQGKKGVKVLIIGALGRCGSGAVDLFRKAGVVEENIIKWDMAETAKGGPFPEILNVDIFVNCIYLSKPIPKFITSEFIAEAGADRRLSVVVDVSCDTTNPHNPIPIYSINTTFPSPTVEVDTKGVGKRCTVISIDHLPTLLPREASEQFSTDLLPSLLQLPERKTAEVWVNAEKLFREKLEEARKYDEEHGIKA